MPTTQRSTPTLQHVQPDELADYMTMVMRNFHGEYHGDQQELEKQVMTPDRTFGFKAGDRWISSTADYARTMAVPGGALVDIGAVTIVTVSPTYRRRGLLRQMMTHQLDLIRDRGDAMALLWASESLIYGRFGYGGAVQLAHYTGRTRELEFLPSIDLGDGDVVEVDKEEFLARVPAVRDALQPERPGQLNRDAAWWEFTLHDPERWRQGATPQRYLLHLDAAGAVDGYAIYRIKEGWNEETGNDTEVQIAELDALTTPGYAQLWRFLLDLDLVRKFRRSGAVDDVIKHLVTNPRMIRTRVQDGTYLRLLDVKRSLEARAYLTEVDVVLEITDAMQPQNAGRWHLQGGPDGATVKKARRRPDLSLDTKELATAYLGGVPLLQLADAGLVTEHRDGTLLPTSIAFGWTRAPYTPDDF